MQKCEYNGMPWIQNVSKGREMADHTAIKDGFASIKAWESKSISPDETWNWNTCGVGF